MQGDYPSFNRLVCPWLAKVRLCRETANETSVHIEGIYIGRLSFINPFIRDLW